jgi:hypothetical protein
MKKLVSFVFNILLESFVTCFLNGHAKYQNRRRVCAFHPLPVKLHIEPVHVIRALFLILFPCSQSLFTGQDK